MNYELWYDYTDTIIIQYHDSVRSKDSQTFVKFHTLKEIWWENIAT